MLCYTMPRYAMLCYLDIPACIRPQPNGVERKKIRFILLHRHRTKVNIQVTLQGQSGDKILRTGNEIWGYFLLNQCFSHNIFAFLMDELFKIGNRSSSNWNTEQYSSQSRKEASGFCEFPQYGLHAFPPIGLLSSMKHFPLAVRNTSPFLPHSYSRCITVHKYRDRLRIYIKSFTSKSKKQVYDF